MKVLFLAPQVRLGAGGVADYVHYLGQALAARGHVIIAAGLRTPPPIEAREKTPLQVGEGSWESLEFPSGMPWRKLGAELRTLCHRTRPDLISLQFVNYGFGKYGLIPGMATALSAAINGCPVHIFFHELWQGHARTATLRDRMLGWLQARQILHLQKTLAPVRSTTSNLYYQRVLERESIAADVLPVFGNVPVSNDDGREWLAGMLQEKGILGCGEALGSMLTFGLFASIHAGWPFAEIIPHLAECARASGRKPVLVLLGRNGPRNALCNYLSEHFGARFPVAVVGELAPQELDRALSSMDAGVSTTPAEGLGKSGAASAFLERGVPVLASAGGLDRDPIGLWPRDPQVWPVDGRLAERFGKWVKAPGSGLPRVVDYYLGLKDMIPALAPSP